MLLYMQTYLYKNFKDTQLIENWGNNFWQKKWFPQKLHVFQITRKYLWSSIGLTQGVLCIYGI